MSFKSYNVCVILCQLLLLFPLVLSAASGGNSNSCGLPNAPFVSCGRGGAMRQDAEDEMLNNSALIFIKPDAHTPAVIDYVKERLAEAGLTILQEKVILPTVQMVDDHYFAISSKACVNNLYEQIPFDGEPVKVYGATRACKEFFDGDEKKLAAEWNNAEKVIKVGSGMYCGKLRAPADHDHDFIYVMNGFYLNMRSALTASNRGIYAMKVEWSPKHSLTWKQFRGQFIGATDPSKAHFTSIRNYIYKNYQSLGLDNQPTISLNGVHASASPLEAHVELTNWLEQNDDGDELATADPWVTACSKHLSHLFYKECQKDTNIFDQVEDLDANECLQKLIEIQQQRET